SQFAHDYLCLFEQFLKEEYPSFSKNLINNQFNMQEMIDISLEFLLTDSKVFDILKHQYNLVQPIEIVHPETGSKIQYIPIAEMLASIIKNEHLMKFFVEPCINNCNFFTSTYFKECISSLVTSDSGIFLKLYSDEIEVCNPIGSAKTKHKLCVIYYSILNFPEYLNSSLELSFLSTIFSESTIKKASLQFCLSPLIAELNDLYYKEFEINTSLTLPVVACFMTGDNLSMHQMLGLQKCFSSGYICRFCYKEYRQLCSIDIQCLDKLFQFNYRTHLSNINDSQQLNNGFVRNSAFEGLSYIDLQYFFPPDIMHDDLEGFSHLVVCLVLLNAMEKNHISMEFINEQFSKIYDVSLPKLSKYNIKNFHLPCTASQMIVILQYFGLLFGDLFDYDDDIWILFCNHKLFLNIILSPYYDKDVDIDYFKFLVAVQLETIYKYTDFNPKYKCKLHYICHYPELYHYFSGLRYLWCMRSEAQHQVIKNISRQCKNYNNVAFTCAKNFQIQKALVVTHFMPHDLKEAV
ncbi:hypothetical protein BOX15_Mlig020007g1, partial [Macrostomum lignano]